MAKFALLVSLAIILAGCAGANDLSGSESSNEEPRVVSLPAEWRVLDVNRTFQNEPAAGLSEDWEVARLTTPQNTSALRFEFVRHHRSVNFFAPNCRVFTGDTLVEQDAFSDAQYGQIDTTGTCTLNITAEPNTEYRAMYGDDQMDPTGTHELRLQVFAIRA